MIVTIAATFSSAKDLPILFFRLASPSNSSLFSSVTDLYYRMILVLTTAAKTSAPQLINIAGQENTLAIQLPTAKRVRRKFIRNPGLCSLAGYRNYTFFWIDSH